MFAISVVGSMRKMGSNVSTPICWNPMYYFSQYSDELRSVVVDGVTVGHPCCAEHDCRRPLESARHRYCSYHAHLSDLCVVVSCNTLAEIGFKTCLDLDHRALETKYDMAGKAMFQLRRRLERVKSYQTHNALATNPNSDKSTEDFEGSGVGDDQDTEVTADDCDGKPSTGNQKIRARFGRRRTHNDELCVASCGVILGRTTFYGSEAPSAVRV